MSLSQKDLSSIQKAGLAAHIASEAISQTMQSQAQNMVSNLTSQPFSTELSQVIERFKSLSALSQGLVAVEAQLQKLYALAGELANPIADVIALPAVANRRSLTNAAAVDVVAKPARSAKKVKVRGRKVAAPGALTANDAKLLAFLQGALQVDTQTNLTGSAMATGSGLPLGSVGVSLKKLLAVGTVKLMGRGSYQLAANSAKETVSSDIAKNDGTAAPKRMKTPKAKIAAPNKLPKAGKKVKAVSSRKKTDDAPIDASPAADVAPL